MKLTRRNFLAAGAATGRSPASFDNRNSSFGLRPVLHFASCVPKIGSWQEYKEGVKPYGEWFNPPLRILDGALTVPQGPGVGIAEPKEVLKDAEAAKTGGL